MTSKEQLIETLKSATTEQLIRKFLELRRGRDKAQAAFVDSERERLMIMEAINSVITTRLVEDDVESMKTDAGTAYKSNKVSVKVEDWDAAFEFVLDQQRYEFLEHKINKTAVQEYLQEHGVLPPGVSLKSDLRVNIRVK